MNPAQLGAHHHLIDAKKRLRTHFGWLPGYPVAIDDGVLHWKRIHPSAPWNDDAIVITRGHLDRSEAALRELKVSFAHALPKLIPNVEFWSERLQQLIDVLHTSLEEGELPHPSRSFLGTGTTRRWLARFSALRSQSHLVPFLDRVFYFEYTGRKEPSLGVLRWIEEHQRLLERLSWRRMPGGEAQIVAVQWLFCMLRKEMTPGSEAMLCDVLSNAQSWDLTTPDNSYGLVLSRSLASFLYSKEKKYTIPKRPISAVSSFGKWFHMFLESLAALKPAQRKPILQLWEELRIREFTPFLEQHLAELTREEKRLMNLAVDEQNRGVLFPPDLTPELTAENAAHNVAITTQRSLDGLKFAVRSTDQLSRHPKRLELWRRFLEVCGPREDVTRLWLFETWESIGNPRNVCWMLERLTELTRQHGRSPLLEEYWAHKATSSNPRADEFIGLLIAGSYRPALFHRVFVLLEELIFRKPVRVTRGFLKCLIPCAEATTDMAKSLRFLDRLRQDSDWNIYEIYLRALFAIMDEDDDPVSLYRGIHSADIQTAVTGLGNSIEDPALREVIRRLIRGKQTAAINELARLTNVVTTLELELRPVSTYAARSEWWSIYPAALHDALKQLSEVTANAESVAESILSKDFPNPEKLDVELRAIHEKISRETDWRQKYGLYKRAASLRQRRDSLKLPSPKRLANLNQKLIQRADRFLTADYAEACQTAVLHALRDMNSDVDFSAKIFQSPYPELLSGMMTLETETRELGLRLVCESVRDAAWSFLPDDRNTAFVERMESQGIAMEPWAKGDYSVTTTTEKGLPIRLKFTRRILDFLLMGFHFDTCLSPHSFNFFSAISNAVDVNKQVVYGRGPEGEIIGRCLFVLTNAGTILTYNRYAHDHCDEFSAAIDEFARGLTERMGTVLDSDGTVSNLVAKDWYDDDAFNFEGLWQLHSSQSPIRTLIRDASPEDLIDRLKEIIGPHFAFESALGSIVGLEEFTNRAQLLAPLAEQFGTDENVSLCVRLRLAVLSAIQERTPTAFAILDSLKTNQIVRQLIRGECSVSKNFRGVGSYADVMGLISRYNPTLALRVIRGTRAYHIKRDEDEEHANRRRVLAQIHRKLGREHLAHKLSQPA